MHSSVATANTTELETLSILQLMLANCESTEELYADVIPQVREIANFQTAAVFLLSKKGILERKTICGKDANGQPLEDEWYPDEQYIPGENITGSIIPIKPQSSTFGSLKLSTNPIADGADEESVRQYAAKLGPVRSVVSVPLNGKKQTFGVLELVNKIEADGHLCDDLDTLRTDVLLIEFLAQLLASSLSQLRTRQTALHLADLAKTFANGSGASADLEPELQYKEILDHFVSPDSPFSAAVLTLLRGHGLHEYACKACDDGITWETWVDQELPPGFYLAGKTVGSGKPEIVENIETVPDLFFNIKWIRENQLRSCACLPITLFREQHGTLSLFTRYYHNFDEWAIEILGRLGYSVATFVFAVQIMSALAELNEEIAGRRKKIIRTSRKALLRLGYQRTLTRFLHEEKNLLRDIVPRLKLVENTNKTARLQAAVRETAKELEKRSRQIEDQMDQAEPERTVVNLNSLVRELATYHGLDSSRQQIQINVECAEDVPQLRLVYPEIHELINILMHNAVRAVEESGREDGEISLRTFVVRKRDLDYVGIEVEDNGVGIRHEKLGACPSIQNPAGSTTIYCSFEKC